MGAHRFCNVIKPFRALSILLSLILQYIYIDHVEVSFTHRVNIRPHLFVFSLAPFALLSSAMSPSSSFFLLLLLLCFLFLLHPFFNAVLASQVAKLLCLPSGSTRDRYLCLMSWMGRERERGRSGRPDAVQVAFLFWRIIRILVMNKPRGSPVIHEHKEGI